MATPPIPEEILKETLEVLENAGGNQTHASATLGISRSGLQSRMAQAARRGLLGTEPVLPGFQISKTTTVTDAGGRVVREFVQQKPEPQGELVIPEGHVIKGISTYTDSNGRVIGQWTKTKEGELDPMWVADKLKSAFQDYKPAAKVSRAPKISNEDLLTLVPCNDWHLGMYSWHQQTAENWDLKIATDAIARGIEDTIFQTRPSGTAVVLVGGDLLHADNQSNETSHSGNQLDVDGRYPKILEAAGMLIVHTVDCALQHHQHVIVRVLPGNHDEHSSFAIAMFLTAWYRKDTRVVVDTDRSNFWWYRFGDVLLGSTHGHTVKIKDMPGIMAARQAEAWGATKYRYVHGFHLHHKEKIANEGGGVICEIHQAPIPQDAWHYNSGFLSGRSLQAITYHRERGEISRVVTAM
jgi:hypothetical protein